MVEAIGGEVFGTVSLTTFEYICAYGFILYPLVSLPLLVYFWTNHSDENRASGNGTFELPAALKNSSSNDTPSVSPTGDCKDSSLDHILVTDVGSKNTSEIISTTSRHNITFIGKRRAAPSTKSESTNIGNVIQLAQRSKMNIDSGGEQHPIEEGNSPRDRLTAVARDIALSSDSTADLRAAALDYLISSRHPQKLCKRKISAYGS